MKRTLWPSTHPRSFSSISKLILVVILAAFISACSSGSTDPNGGDDDDPPMDTPEPTFANVQQIFNGSCTGSGCHIGERTSGVRLDSYDNVTNSVGDQYGELVVQPNDADGSPLVDKIEPNPQFGVRMPKGRSALSDEQIQLIRDWINDGAPNN